MRECWINVYPEMAVDGGRYCGVPSKTPERANSAACGFEQPEPGELRGLGVGYRLHVRLKVPVLPDSDALAAGKAGEEGRAM